MKNKELPLSVIEALESGPFHTLSKSLQGEVLDHMSEKEFNESYNAIADFKKVDAQMDQHFSQLPNHPLTPKSVDNLESSISMWKAIMGMILIAIASFFIGRLSVSSDDCPQSQDVIFASQDTLGRSLAEDNYPNQLKVSF